MNLHMTPTELAALLVVQLASATRILQATKAFWGFMPPKYQWVLPTLATFLVEFVARLQSGVTSATDLIVSFLFVAGSVLPGARSNVHAALDGAMQLIANDPKTQAISSESYRRLTRGGARPSTAVMIATSLCFLFGTTGCAGLTNDAESALNVIAKVGVWAADADAWLQQNEAKIVSLAPSADRELLQADFDKAQADYRAAIQLEGDATTLTEAAIAKDWAAFASDAEKLATDAEQVGLFKVPAAASSNAVPAGASPPAVPQSSPPPLPLIVRHLKGQV